MFSHCSSLKDISSLEKWNISNEFKLNECPSTSDFILTPYNFSYMFSKCSSLTNIKSLEKWNELITL